MFGHDASRPCIRSSSCPSSPSDTILNGTARVVVPGERIGVRDLLLATRNVVRQQRRSMVALIAIAAGVAALVFAGGFVDWILRELREQTIRSQLGHIQVRAKPGSTAGRSEPRLPGSGQVRMRVTRGMHVKSVAARLKISGLISRNDTTLGFTGDGIEPMLDVASGVDDLISGRPLNAGKADHILVGEGLAASLAMRPGDKAVLLVNLPGGGINARDVIVAGIFRTISKAYDDAAVRVPLALAQELLRARDVDVWIVTLDSTEATAEALAALRADPALSGLEFIPWTDLADFYNKAVVLYAHQFAVMQALIAIIIVLSIMNTMMMNVSERTWEIGTMMAIGTSRRTILRMFVLEGLVLGVIGGVAGVVLGFVLNSAASMVGIPMPAAPGMRHGFLAQASFEAGIAASAFALAVVTTVAASVPPAFTASRLVIVDALRASH